MRTHGLSPSTSDKRAGRASFEFDFAQGIPSPYRRRTPTLEHESNGILTQGGGVGRWNPRETRPDTSTRSAASAMGEPRLQLRAYLTAPDRRAVVADGCGFNHPARLAGPQETCGKPQNIDVARASIRRVRMDRVNQWCSMEANAEDPEPQLPPASLSPREQECLQWVCRGKSSADIGTMVVVPFEKRTFTAIE